jgi:hypothetical protein
MYLCWAILLLPLTIDVQFRFDNKTMNPYDILHVLIIHVAIDVFKFVVMLVRY